MHNSSFTILIREDSLSSASAILVIRSMLAGFPLWLWSSHSPSACDGAKIACTRLTRVFVCFGASLASSSPAYFGFCDPNLRRPSAIRVIRSMLAGFPFWLLSSHSQSACDGHLRRSLVICSILACVSTLETRLTFVCTCSGAPVCSATCVFTRLATPQPSKTRLFIHYDAPGSPTTLPNINVFRDKVLQEAGRDKVLQKAGRDKVLQEAGRDKVLQKSCFIPCFKQEHPRK